MATTKAGSACAGAVIALALGGCGGGSSDPDETVPAVPAADPATGQAASDEAVADALPIDTVNGFRETASRTYDGDGRLVRRSETRTDGNGRDALTVAEFFDDDGVRFESSGRSEVDGDGRLVRSTYDEPDPDDPSFDFRSESVYEYDGQGRLLSRATEDSFTLDGPESERFEWDGARLLARRQRPGEFLGHAFEYAYDDGTALPSSARLTRWVEDDDAPFDPAADIPLTTEITSQAYDWDGPERMREKRFDYGDDGTVDETGTYEYDGDGNMIRATFTGADGRVLSVREYDYAPTEAPFHNAWLRIFRFFP